MARAGGGDTRAAAVAVAAGLARAARKLYDLKN
jgi:hypothetical protein